MLRLAISPCPNDTFAFFGLLHGKTAFREPLDVRFEDIEALNRLCFAGQVDICKISFSAYLRVRDRYRLLETGSALGFGCGPLVVARQPLTPELLRRHPIAVPGFNTTAALLLRLWLGPDLELVEQPFDRIMPAVAAGRFAAGLIIHESRFTYERFDLIRVIDLGSWWERESGHPIPLGCIVARHDLESGRVAAFDRALGESIDYAWKHEAETQPFMKAHAQEMEPEVMKNHVALYVNRFTRGLGARGRAAIAHLAETAAALEAGSRP